MKIYLASKSPRRQSLLRQIGIEFETIQGKIDETPQANEKAIDYVERMAIEKAKKGWHSANRIQELPLLAADTSVILNGIILGKPSDNEHALSMLQQLSGNTHQVITSISVINDNKQELTTSVTDVCFDYLSKSIIDYYVATGDCADKAGSYGIQGFAARFVTSISGSYSGIVGLPLFETGKLLEKFE